MPCAIVLTLVLETTLRAYSMALLEIDNLSIAVYAESGWLPVVEEFSVKLPTNHTLGIVGESGCGKSLTAMAVMGLLEGTQVRVTGGRIIFDGVNLLALAANERRKIMGNQMAMIFQEPMTSLNPVYRVGDQVVEVLRQHRRISLSQALSRAVELLSMVKMPNPEQTVRSYPHQLSGGQRQRVMIAMALACDPSLIIADEPTTALDVTVQKEVLDLMSDLQNRTGTSIILISHDLGVIAETCDEVAVMYRGKVIESAMTNELFSNIQHPYTAGLLRSIPSIVSDVEWLEAIPGRVPTLQEFVPGCAFHPRCAHVRTECTTSSPDLSSSGADHHVRCHFAGALTL